jgi:hypothetical protein
MATATTHRYWEATAHPAQEINFYKNAGILAGLAHGARQVAGPTVPGSRWPRKSRRRDHMS